MCLNYLRMVDKYPAPLLFFTNQIWFTVTIAVACFLPRLQYGIGAMGFDNRRLIAETIDRPILMIGRDRSLF